MQFGDNVATIIWKSTRICMCQQVIVVDRRKKACARTRSFNRYHNEETPTLTSNIFFLLIFLLFLIFLVFLWSIFIYFFVCVVLQSKQQSPEKSLSDSSGRSCFFISSFLFSIFVVFAAMPNRYLINDVGAVVVVVDGACAPSAFTCPRKIARFSVVSFRTDLIEWSITNGKIKEKKRNKHDFQLWIRLTVFTSFHSVRNQRIYFILIEIQTKCRQN